MKTLLEMPGRYLLAVPLLMGLLFATFLSQSYNSQNGQLLIDAQIDKGNYIEIFINENYFDSQQREIIPGERRTYLFDLHDLPTRSIEQLRIDPSDKVNATVSLFEISLLKDGLVAQSMPLELMAGWSKNGINLTTTSNKQLSLISTSNDPILEGHLNLAIPTRASPLTRLTSFLFASLYGKMGFYIFTIFCFFLLIALSLKTKQAAVLILSLLASLLAAYHVVKNIIQPLEMLPPPVTQAVGNLAVFDYSLSKSILSLCSCFLILASSGAMIGKFILRSVSSRSRHDDNQLCQTHNKTNYLVFVFLLACALVWLFPPVLSLNVVGKVFHPTDYDSQNIIAWKFATFKGWSVFKDYWYPYGLQILTSLPWPPALLASFLHKFFLTAGFICTLYFTLHCSLRWLVGAVFLAFLGGNIGIFDALSLNRYFLSALLIMALPMVITSHRPVLPIFYAFWLIYATAFDLPQLYYAGPACALIFFGELIRLRKNKESLTTLLKNTALIAFCSTLGATIILYTLHYRGQLEGFLKFTMTLGQQANYCAIPVDVSEWLLPHTYTVNIVILCWLIITFVSAFCIYLPNTSYKSLYKYTPLALCIATTLVLQKQVIRPHMILQLSFFPLLAGYLCLHQLYLRRQSKKHFFNIATCLVIGFGTGLFLINNSLAVGLAKQIRDRFRSFPQQVEAVISPPNPWAKVARNYFTPKSFTLFGEDGDHFKRNLSRIIQKEDFYVFGDDALIYVLFKRKIPPYITFYNSSILYSQKELISWLEKENPLYVLWNPNDQLFDGVHNSVRVPLVYNFVTMHYSPYDKYGDLNIIKRRSPLDPINIEYWEQHLDNTVNLGAIPALSQVKDYIATPTDKSQIPSTYAIVSSNSKQAYNDSILLQIQDMSFEVVFRIKPNFHKYYIRLDRVWFYHLAKESGIPVLIPDHTTKGNKLKVKPILLNQDILY